VKKPLKTSSKSAVKKTSNAASAKAKATAPAKKASKPSPAKPAKSVSAKAASKAKPVGKNLAPKAAAKPVAKPIAKVAKPAPKAVSQSAAKPAAKVIGKAPVKAAVNAKVSKPVQKTVAKPAPKAVSKPVAKVNPSAKPAPKVAAKAASKPDSKTVAKAAPLAPTQAAAKSAPKAPEKAKVSIKAEKPSKVDKPAKAEKVTLPPVAAPAVTPVAAGDVPARAVRPSARLAQITVPSMAQSVASTAAKASYLQNMPSPALTPPPFVAVKKDPKLANNWKTKKPDQLSDAEVMAMSDNDYMNDAQMAFFRHKLVILKQGILANAGETTEHLREDTVVVPDPADRATIEEEHALELRTRDRERKLLKKIEQSIQRIDAGDYGYCDETGEPIGVGRLLARPTANLSLEAQQRRELKQKMFGD
jgi:DnaK suppressor protein